MQDKSDKRRSAEENKTMEAKAEIKHEGIDDTDRTFRSGKNPSLFSYFKSRIIFSFVIYIGLKLRVFHVAMEIL